MRDLNPPRNKWILYCRDIHTAMLYAAEQDWWLHSWKWITDENATDEVVVYAREN
jgi:hypothetical protein